MFNAEGASFLGALGSPPGWYWYLPSPPADSHGLLFSAWLTLRSEEELVGDRAVIVSYGGLSCTSEVHGTGIRKAYKSAIQQRRRYRS